MVFRSVDAELPKHLIGRNRGYLNISALSFEPTASSEQLPSDKVRLSTKFDSYKLAHRASIQEGGNTKWDVPTPIQLAFKNRRFSRLSFEFGRGFQIAGIGKDAEALAALRLGHVPDNEPLNLKLPVVVGDDLEDFQEHVRNPGRS